METRSSASTVAELDALLEDATLGEVKVQFWKRYRLMFPADVMPSDQLVSRCFRELDRRLLIVHDVWKTRNLMHQVSSTKMRKRLGTDRFTFEEEQESVHRMQWRAT